MTHVVRQSKVKAVAEAVIVTQNWEISLNDELNAQHLRSPLDCLSKKTKIEIATGGAVVDKI